MRKLWYVLFFIAINLLIAGQKVCFIDTVNTDTRLYLDVNTTQEVKVFLDNRFIGLINDSISYNYTKLSTGSHEVKVSFDKNNQHKKIVLKKSNKNFCSFNFKKAPPVINSSNYLTDDFQLDYQNPEIIGGVEALAKNLVYPRMAHKAGVNGKVSVKFTCDTTGLAENPQVIMEKPRDLGFDTPALNAIKSARFKSARQKTKLVPVTMVIPFTFEIKKKD